VCGSFGYQSASLAQQQATQHSVHPTGGSRRVFRQFAWLEVGSGKMALSRPAHPRVTHTVGLPLAQSNNWEKKYEKQNVAIIIYALVVGSITNCL
jgi:hypothetical protein